MASKSPHDMMAAVTESMQKRTGHTLQEWVAIVHSSGIDPLDQHGVRRWLKNAHGVLQNSQWAIADAAARAAGWKEPTIEECIGQQYTGAKAALRPIFDRVRRIVEGFGTDIRMEGRATYTPFVRRRQFAAVAAATRLRVDVGLRFTRAPDSGILSVANGPGQATHRLSLMSPGDVTAEVGQLLRVAYEQNG